MLPLADLLYADPYAVLMAGVTYGRYLGLHQAAGVACHHLAFSQDTIEWQIWIDAGDKPLPRKLVISYVQEPGEPQYSAIIRRWSLESEVPEGLFTFEAPEGAQKIDAEGHEAARGRGRPAPRRRLRREDADAGQESSVLAAARVRGGGDDPAARAARGARLRAASRRRRWRPSIARIGQQRQPQRRGHGRELVERALERHHQPHDVGQQLEPHDHGPDPERARRRRASRNVTKSGDEVTVNRNVQTSSGASKSSQKTYEMDDGRVESVERDVQATSRSGQTANWEGKAERSGAGWEFEGEGNNKYGQKVEAEGYGARGPYGGGVVADVEGGRYGDRTVVAGGAYGGPVHAANASLRRPSLQLPRPLVLRLRRRLLSALHLPRRSVLRLHAPALGLLLLDGPGRRHRADDRGHGDALLGRHLLQDDLRRGGDAVPGRRAAGGGDASPRAPRCPPTGPPSPSPG